MAKQQGPGQRIPQHLLDDETFRIALADGDWQAVLSSIVRDTDTTQVALAALTGISQPHLSRLISGQSQEPGIKTIRALCDGLGIPRQLAGLAPSGEDDTNRRQTLAAGTGAAGLALLSAFGVSPAGNVDHALLAEVTTVLRKLEQHTSTRVLLPSALSHAELTRQIRGRAGRNAQTRRLSGVESEAAGFAAWLYADLDERANARRAYRHAVAAAVLSGNILLTCYMRGSFGQFATMAGDAVQGHQLIQQTQAQLPRSAPPIAGLWLDALEAAALAQLGDRRAMALLDRAEGRLSKPGNSEPVWPWVFHFDEPKLASYRAIAAARLGLFRTAEAAFNIADQGSQSPKQRALASVTRATALATNGSLDQACALASTALDTGRKLGSERIIRAVGTFRTNLGQHRGTGISELDTQLAESYLEDA